MSKVKFLVLFGMVAALLLALPATAAAQALPPSGFYGNVTAAGKDLAAGTSIDVLVDGKKVTTTKTLTYQGKSVYNVNVVGDAVLTGKTVEFAVGTLKAKETGKWASGSNVALNLSFAALPATGDEHLPLVWGAVLVLGLLSLAGGTVALRRARA